MDSKLSLPRRQTAMMSASVTSCAVISVSIAIVGLLTGQKRSSNRRDDNSNADQDELGGCMQRATGMCGNGAPHPLEKLIRHQGACYQAISGATALSNGSARLS